MMLVRGDKLGGATLGGGPNRELGGTHLSFGLAWDLGYDMWPDRHLKNIKINSLPLPITTTKDSTYTTDHKHIPSKFHTQITMADQVKVRLQILSPIFNH